MQNILLGWGENTDYPGEVISDSGTSQGLVETLHEIINQPSHFSPGKNSSFIGLIFC